MRVADKLNKWRRCRAVLQGLLLATATILAPLALHQVWTAGHEHQHHAGETTNPPFDEPDGTYAFCLMCLFLPTPLVIAVDGIPIWRALILLGLAPLSANLQLRSIYRIKARGPPEILHNF